MVRESGLLKEKEEHYELTGPLPPLAIPATLPVLELVLTREGPDVDESQLTRHSERIGRTIVSRVGVVGDRLGIRQIQIFQR